MAELRERLQAVVGNTFRIERELGGGGMSRVFLATEPALGRQVVVKVLPPELGAGVNVERFRREIQLAASLQHPHVVQLLTAGAADDLLYYVMPFISGHSLREKLAREGELPVGEAARILHDIVEALAYAHAHGVVHRDIKPDNVLVSGHHAVVTDFGVAKAVSASSDESGLTSVGVALGTPAYMAPEQAAADPHVDHRADLYAVGVVGYEMLAGRLPFSAPSPRAMLAAHMTVQPEPVTATRPAVPAEFDALIMRCLEKRPADRWQRAEELLAALEGMMTPVGMASITPDRGQRAVGGGRFAAGFTLAALVLLAAIRLVTRDLGLPNWVFDAAVILVVAAWPVMLATAMAERQRATALSGANARRSPARLSWLTWRRAVIGGAVAFGGFGVAVAGYLALRVLGIGPVGTLLAKGAIQAREPIVLSDFENRTADSSLGPTLTEAFRVDLSQSRSVKLVDAVRIAEGLRRMQQDASTPLNAALAREFAQREGVKAVVTGEIDPVGKGYVLLASLVSAGDGAVLAAVRETAPDDGALISAIDRLSRALRERIGESLVSIRANEPLEQVTTRSLDALQRYTRAVRAAARGEDEQAAGLLREAVALDTGFAMAYRKLAVALKNTHGPVEEIVAASTHAFAHRDRLPPLERDATTAYYYESVDYDPAQAIAAYRDALTIEPTDPVSLNNLASQLSKEGQFAAAESLVVRGIALGRCGSTCYENAAIAQIFEGHVADAESTVARFARAFPSDPALLEVQVGIAGNHHDYATANRLLHEVHDAPQPSPLWREESSIGLASVAITQGQLALAERYLREAMMTAEQRGLNDHYVDAAATFALVVDDRVRGRRAQALAAIQQALERHPLESIPAYDRPYSALAQAYAQSGEPAEAARLLAAYERSVPLGLRNGDAERHAAAGDVATAEGRLQDALTAYTAYREESGCVECGLFEQAQLYERLGVADSALALYERLASVNSPFRSYTVDPSYLAITYRRLGELHEARHDWAKALAYYGRFVDLWKGADPELQPTVRDVRARMARVAAMGDP